VSLPVRSGRRGRARTQLTLTTGIRDGSCLCPRRPRRQGQRRSGGKSRPSALPHQHQGSRSSRVSRGQAVYIRIVTMQQIIDSALTGCRVADASLPRYSGRFAAVVEIAPAASRVRHLRSRLRLAPLDSANTQPNQVMGMQSGGGHAKSARPTSAKPLAISAHSKKDRTALRSVPPPQTWPVQPEVPRSPLSRHALC
jgi:hypothetical protein